MKTVGIVGGLGPESTIDYYRSIISLYRAKVANKSYPSIIINSLDFEKALHLVTAGELQRLAEYFIAAVQSLANAGADFALLSANTAHVVFDEVRNHAPLPLLSIVEATCNEVKAHQLTKVSILGTRFTMNGRFYPDVLSKEHITIVPPSAEEQAYIHEKYLGELVEGIFLPETRARLERIIETQKARDGVQAVILAGTELPLILRDPTVAGIPLLDTTQIHVRAAVAQMLT